MNIHQCSSCNCIKFNLTIEDKSRLICKGCNSTYILEEKKLLEALKNKKSCCKVFKIKEEENQVSLLCTLCNSKYNIKDNNSSTINREHNQIKVSNINYIQVEKLNEKKKWQKKKENLKIFQGYDEDSERDITISDSSSLYEKEEVTSKLNLIIIYQIRVFREYIATSKNLREIAIVAPLLRTLEFTKEMLYMDTYDNNRIFDIIITLTHCYSIMNNKNIYPLATFEDLDTNKKIEIVDNVFQVIYNEKVDSIMEMIYEAFEKEMVQV